MSDEVIKPPNINNNSLPPKLQYIENNMFMKFNKKILNIYIVYDLDSNLNNFDPILENCLFRAIKITKGVFSHPTGRFGNNAVVFGVDASGSIHASNRANSISVLEKSLTKINNTTVYAEKVYSINFSATKKRLFLSLHYNGDNSYLFVNGKEIVKFKEKDSEIVEDPIFLGNISKDFSESNMKKTGLYGSVYYFSIDRNAVTVDKILDIHDYPHKKYAV